MKLQERGISIELLHEMFKLDAESGVIRWKSRPAGHFKPGPSRSAEQIANKINSQHAGTVAFTSRHQRGYLRAELGGKLFQAHRVAFALFHGRWPESTVDHINGDPSDNRPANLRDVTHAENMRNQALRTDNKSGRVGVYAHKQSGKWAAAIRKDARVISLGLHETREAAIAARAAADRTYGYHPNHGRKAA